MLWNKASISSRFRDIGLRVYWVTTLTFQGHVTSSVTWSFDSQVPISYRRSIVTKSLSPAIFEILASKVYWGYDLDLLGSCDVIGHVTIGLTVSLSNFSQPCLRPVLHLPSYPSAPSSSIPFFNSFSLTEIPQTFHQFVWLLFHFLNFSYADSWKDNLK